MDFGGPRRCGVGRRGVAAEVQSAKLCRIRGCEGMEVYGDVRCDSV